MCTWFDDANQAGSRKQEAEGRKQGRRVAPVLLWTVELVNWGLGSDEAMLQGEIRTEDSDDDQTQHRTSARHGGDCGGGLLL